MCSSFSREILEILIILLKHIHEQFL
jgi:hypothetical protein